MSFAKFPKLQFFMREKLLTLYTVNDVGFRELEVVFFNGIFFSVF